MVELAVVLPLFLLLIFGVMEASWAFAQVNDAHHGVREGARLAAVNFDAGDADPSDDVLDEMCTRMNLVGTSGTTVTLAASDTNGDGTIGRGDTGNSAVSVTYTGLTGFLLPIFNPGTLDANVNFLLEQPLDTSGVSWTGTQTC